MQQKERGTSLLAAVLGNGEASAIIGGIADQADAHLAAAGLGQQRLCGRMSRGE